MMEQFLLILILNIRACACVNLTLIANHIPSPCLYPGRYVSPKKMKFCVLITSFWQRQIVAKKPSEGYQHVVNFNHIFTVSPIGFCVCHIKTNAPALKIKKLIAHAKKSTKINYNSGLLSTFSFS